MVDPIFNDSAMQAAKMALDGLSMRQQIISQNVANVDTPGYHAKQVNFETVLNQVMDRKQTFSMAATNGRHLASPSQASGSFMPIQERPGGSERADGNNVDIDLELLQMSETGIQYQAISQQISKKLLLLKTIVAS